MSRQMPKIELNNFNELFGIHENATDIIDVALTELHPFPNHPYQVRDDQEMEELIKSVREQGVLVPGVVRPSRNGGYEIISGHRRKFASEKAGRLTMPVIVREYDDDAATVAMVDSNYHRKNMLPSELARSYHMKYEAIRHQGKHKECGNTADLIGKLEGASGRTIQRYVRLVRLIPEFMDMVDRKELGVSQGVILAGFLPKHQETLYESARESGIRLTNAHITRFSRCADGKITRSIVEEVLSCEPKRSQNVLLRADRLRQLLGMTLTPQELQEKAYTILEAWANAQKAEGAEA